MITLLGLAMIVATRRSASIRDATRYRWASLGLVVVAFVLALSASAQQITKIEYVTFDTNTVPNTAASTPVRLRALLYVPTSTELPMSAVAITPSSGNVRDDIEIYYASTLARAGIAALVIDSFGSRGISSTVYDQSLLTPWETGNDAIAGLRWLVADPRFRADRIGVLGVSKGGIVAMNTALTRYRTWAGMSGPQFAAHVAIVPSCGWVPRSTATTGAPILFMLAELDDQCPIADCIDYAESLRTAGNSKIQVNVYRGAHHAWEIIGTTPYFDKWAENFAKCRVWIEDDRSNTAADGTRFVANDWHEWAKTNCITLGTSCCGGNETLKRQATDDLLAFLKESGF